MKKIIYPGSFDPVTNGHLDLIERASKLFDEITVAVAVNTEKKALFSIEERVELLKNVCSELSNVNVTGFEGLLVDFAKTMKADAVLRGLRAVSDFEFEFQMALMNREMDNNFETIYLMPSVNYLFISSSSIKEISSCNGNISLFVPLIVEKALREKFSND